MHLRGDLIRDPDSDIKRFLEQRDATQLRVREVNRSKRLCRLTSRGAPHESRSRPNHRMAPTHHVQTLDQLTNVAVRARKIAQCHFSPAAPVSIQQTLTSNARVLVTKRIVISEHGWPTIEPALVRGHDVPERRTLVKYIVPREWKIAWRAGLWSIFQAQVRHHP